MREYRTAIADNSRWAGFQPRPDDIVISTPPKCGTTWTQTIVAHLLFPDFDLPAPVMMMSPWLDMTIRPIDEILGVLESQTHRRFIKTHTGAEGIPLFDDTKYIAVGRDGRDAFMSMCNHSARLIGVDDINARAAEAGIPPIPKWDGDPHTYFDSWMQRDEIFFSVLRSWWDRRDMPNLLLVHFADLKADLEAEMRRIADFLDLSVPEERWPALVERCSFEGMRANADVVGDFSMMFEGGAQGFLFKGTNGRWRDVLTPEELERYDAELKARIPDEAARAWIEHGRRGQPV